MLSLLGALKQRVIDEKVVFLFKIKGEIRAKRGG